MAAAWMLASGQQAPAAGQLDLASPKLRIEWAEFKKLYDTQAIVVVDVRGAEAFEAGHIPGARSVPLDQVEARTGELKAVGKPIVFYCS
ncbi:MAG TPA: rhodanese-like domain-containing protein [Vicinamibacterales bacterium]|nr:rhodanese-like domain-containing protein [Vicinamibacterales bacterium]